MPPRGESRPARGGSRAHRMVSRAFLEGRGPFDNIREDQITSVLN